MLPHKYIVIEGNIGAGKTTLAHLLAQHFNGDLLLEEFADNTFLPQFYNDPERFAFPLEMSFMAERYMQLKKIFEQPVSGKPLISDYLFDKSLLFARVNLKENEFKLFENFFNLIKDSIPKPDLLVYLKKEVPRLQKNISKRGRNFEKGIKDDYLENINASYEHFLSSDAGLKKIIIHSSELDFIQNKKDFEIIVDKIINSQAAIQ
ncbi:MAG: deoxynucleoside kinase [Bacteroidota bacterium]